MKRDSRVHGCRMGIALAVVVGLGAATPVLIAPPAQSCCFANDRYKGICSVIPGEGESCQSILSYLNNPMSAGKSYCEGSSVRGGWIQTDCKTGKPIASKQDGTGSGQRPRS